MLWPPRRPEVLGAAVLQVPFVDVLTAMSLPELPLTVHEYDELGDPRDPLAWQQVRREPWRPLGPLSGCCKRAGVCGQSVLLVAW